MYVIVLVYSKNCIIWRDVHLYWTLKRSIYTTKHKNLLFKCNILGATNKFWLYITRPTSPANLLIIEGFSEKMCERFGDEILEFVSKYCIDNDLSVDKMSSDKVIYMRVISTRFKRETEYNFFICFFCYISPISLLWAMTFSVYYIWKYDQFVCF